MSEGRDHWDDAPVGPWRDDGLSEGWLGSAGLGCGIDTGAFSLILTTIVIIVGLNLRRTRKVR